jgi:hypothetical protein
MAAGKWVPYRRVTVCGTCMGTRLVPCHCRPFCREEKKCGRCKGTGHVAGIG